MSVPFIGPSYQLRRKKADSQRLVNMCVTNIESGAGKNGSKVFLQSIPGLTDFSKAALSIVKTQADTALLVDVVQTYTVTATNNGPVSADGASVSDTLPTWFVFSACAIAYSGGAAGPASATAAELTAGVVITTWPDGGVVTMTITGTFSSAGTFDNLAATELQSGVVVRSGTVTTTVTTPAPPAAGLFVAVASSGIGHRAMTSPDGITWTLQSTPADLFWYDSTRGAGLIVAVAGTGTGNRVMTSPDGVTWTSQTSAADNGWRAVCYSSTLSLFCAVAESGTGNRVMTSPDGVTWTTRASAADLLWRDVIWDGSAFIAVASSSTDCVMTSPDGINWTRRTAPYSDWTMLSTNGTRAVAVSQSGSGNNIMYSDDHGATWTALFSGAYGGWQSIAWGDSKFVCVSLDFTSNAVMTSADGVTWSVHASGQDNEWRAVTYGAGLFVAVAQTGSSTRVMTSPDGTTWTTRMSASDVAWGSVNWGLD